MMKDFVLPGRLGNYSLSLAEDKRLDPRILGALSQNAPNFQALSPPEITMESSYSECLSWVDFMDKLLASMDASVLASMPNFDGVDSSDHIIIGCSEYNIKLFVDRPENGSEALPCIVHLHGGGMSFTSARSPSAVRWRKTLAEEGLVVIGVEFRSETLMPGNHPFPAGLEDCASAVRWVKLNAHELGISSLVIAGESGGGNLAVATALKANQEGWIDNIDGVYAMAPMLFGFYGSVPSELLSWRENLDYQGTHEMVRAMRVVYDPNEKHEFNPLAWPYSAKYKDLVGLPPFYITNYELDLIRDEGVVFAQKLRAAGVEAICRTIHGVHHVPEIAMPDVVPELTREAVSSLASFARKFA